MFTAMFLTTIDSLMSRFFKVHLEPNDTTQTSLWLMETLKNPAPPTPSMIRANKRAKELLGEHYMDTKEQAALRDILSVLGRGNCKKNNCEGCKYEMFEARDIALDALGLPHEKPSQEENSHVLREEIIAFLTRRGLTPEEALILLRLPTNS